MSELEYNAAGVVWDFDGTLLNSLKLQESVLTEVLARRNMFVPSHEVFVENFHGRLIDSIREILRRRQSISQTGCKDAGCGRSGSRLKA